MSAPADLHFDLDNLPPAVREAFAAMQAKAAGLEAQTRDDRGWGGDDPPAVVFTYAPPSRRTHAFACQATGRQGSHAMDILKGFEGILQIDVYTGYDALAEP